MSSGPARWTRSGRLQPHAPNDWCLAALLIPLAFLLSCGERGGFFALGTFEKSFSLSLEPVEIPAFKIEELLSERAIRAVVAALGYSLSELERAEADFSDLESVVRASVRIGRPLEARDAEIRALLESTAETYAEVALSRPDKGLRITIDFSSLREVPIDYSRLEDSLIALYDGLRVRIHIEQQLSSIDALLANEAELLALLRSGLLESIRIEEIGVRTLTPSEKRKLEEGEDIESTLSDEVFIEDCVTPSQPRMEGLRALRTELIARRPPTEEGKGPHEDALTLFESRFDVEQAFCSVYVDAPSPELIELLSSASGLAIRVEVEARLPASPLYLGGFFWIRGGTAPLGVRNF